MISLDLEPDLDNANVGKYMSRMNGRLCRCSLFCVNWGHHFSQSINRRRMTLGLCRPVPFCVHQKVLKQERSSKMVKINGEEKAIAGKNLLEYLKENGFEPERVVVEQNLNIIPKNQLGNVIIQDEDVIEVLRFVGGG